MSNKRDWKFIFISILFAVFYVYVIIYPYIDAYVLGKVNLELQIDPEYLNGLLTASSILFGFSSLFVVGQKPTNKSFWVFLLVALFLIIRAGGGIADVALEKSSSVDAMVNLSSCFMANVVSTSYIAGILSYDKLGKNFLKRKS
jgi:hypothetical protein